MPTGLERAYYLQEEWTTFNVQAYKESCKTIYFHIKPSESRKLSFIHKIAKTVRTVTELHYTWDISQIFKLLAATRNHIRGKGRDSSAILSELRRSQHTLCLLLLASTLERDRGYGSVETRNCSNHASAQVAYTIVNNNSPNTF